MACLRIGIMGLLLLSAFGVFDRAQATARVGELMDEFELQSTSGQFYGTKNINDKVTVLFFVGYN